MNKEIASDVAQFMEFVIRKLQKYHPDVEDRHFIFSFEEYLDVWRGNLPKKKDILKKMMDEVNDINEHSECDVEMLKYYISLLSE